MAVVALVTSGDRRIYALPGQLADVERVYGGEYGDEEDQDDVPSSMRLPNELLQQIYSYLSPVDFDSARHSCRTWYLASLDRELLTNMLKQGGWWSSREDVMSKWIARECNLLSPQKSAFVEVGHTDFSAIVPGSVPGDLQGAMSFTVSLCGKFLMAAHGRVVYIYELNHGMPLGLLRPVTKVLCPRRVISCSMDTSAERHSVAFLMEGRVGMVCDITTERTGTSSLASTPQSTEPPVIKSGSASGSGVSSASALLASSSQCACHDHLPSLPMPPEEGPRSVYRNICHPDDPPRSVAICPQRKCVAFGCSAGIELHWVDALTGQDLSRWFPLTSPSDFLYFLPPRRGVDTPRKLRLISSAAGSGSTAVVSCFDAEPWYMRHGRGISVEAGGPSRDVDVDNDESLLSRNVPRDSPLRRLVAASADHFRAVPLSDGYHILFTDPRTGCLCLGTDAPVGSLTRLLRKVWFRPPSQAYSPMPLLYVAGSDTRHGVRVVATFAARPQLDGVPLDERTFSSDTGATEDPNQQLIVFYTVPPDVFHDIRRADAEARSAGYRPPESRRVGHHEPTYGHFNLVSDPFGQDLHYPVEVYGQVVATCGNLTEIALNSSPDLIIWAFAAEGWAKTWALNTGKNEPIINSTAHRDGSVRQYDPDGDVVMAGPAPPETPSELSSLDFNLFDGSPISSSDREPTVLGPHSHGRRCHMLGEIWDMQGGEADALRIDLVEEIGSITRVDIELLS
ncbi:f-box-like domain-containing protein [Trichoderma breve]|uniref:F-box-like domain-containing protein n=1 Tax=Trichoderma breve TaxID=2034170 RepID=A0A9W9E1S0_9HYPO|nr:f-box-like domain-containing protein [Trichoderma breve]KAJ4854943.1 f-box-like domain-containing protein [Trichoderma breve]